MRKSDIKQLTWDKIQPYGDGGMYVTLRMQKTKELVNNPISNEALELIGFNDGDENRKPTDKVFVGFNDSLTQAPLKNWLKEAGITKHITYHCSRHTLGSLQVEAGTSVYTVQHILGHKNVATTQIYAAMADESKRESLTFEHPRQTGKRRKPKGQKKARTLSRWRKPGDDFAVSC